ncbi:hypothetical protein VZT92_008350 [Zoarces viviparus]|uniref:Uncharacterized protein n=1 Tax=Zoarces viviparus TaxID=48416 RepID=A0AAW1FEV7_ZOAVI
MVKEVDRWWSCGGPTEKKASGERPQTAPTCFSKLPPDGTHLFLKVASRRHPPVSQSCHQTAPTCFSKLPPDGTHLFLKVATRLQPQVLS